MPTLAAPPPRRTRRKEARPGEILAAAQDTDWGPIQHAGKLHDRASYRYYWELLKRAAVTGMELPAEAKSRFFA